MKALWIAVLVAPCVHLAQEQEPLPAAPFQVESSVLLPTARLPGEPRLRIEADLGTAELQPAITEQGARVTVLYDGLLVREGGRWVPLFRPADYPTLC
jgi:hypothetical protein